MMPLCVIMLFMCNYAIYCNHAIYCNYAIYNNYAIYCNYAIFENLVLKPLQYLNHTDIDHSHRSWTESI